MRALTAIPALLLIFSLQIQAQPKVFRKIKKEINTTVNSKEFATATIGFCLMDAQTGKVLVEYNSQKSFTPASAMKVVTTGAALALLGDTFRFKTELGYTGEIKNGVLNGDIVLIGGMDPTTGTSRWDTIASNDWGIREPAYFFSNAISTLNIKKITGGIILYPDKYLNGEIPPGFEIGDLSTQYGAAPRGLNYKENYFIYTVNPTPDTAIGLRYTTYDEEGVPNENPAMFWGRDITSVLQDNGIAVTIGPRIGYADTTTAIITWYSRPLIDIATKTNQESINLYAEGILRALSTQQYGYSTLDTSLAIAQRFWKNEVGDLKGLRMTDGSGLSRSNLCTPLLFCKMLSAYTKRDNFDSYYSTFAVAGQSGTVKNFATGTKAEGNARIKTGTMSRVKSYVGYVTGNDGKLYSFALMFNNFEADAKPTAAATKIIALLPQLKMGKFFKVR